MARRSKLLDDVRAFVRKSNGSLGRLPARRAPFPDQVLAIVSAYTSALIWSSNIRELGGADWVESQRRLGEQAARFTPRAGYLALIADLYVDTAAPERAHPLEMLLLRSAAGLAAASTLQAPRRPAVPHPLGESTVDVRLGGFHLVNDLLVDPQASGFLERNLDRQGKQALKRLLLFFAWTRGELGGEIEMDGGAGLAAKTGFPG